MPVPDNEFPWDDAPWAARLENVTPLDADEPPDWMDEIPPSDEHGRVVTASADDGGDDLPGCIDFEAWEGNKAPFRRFIIPGWLIRGACGLLSGQEGVGKSLLAQQMATCAAAGIPFLGLEIARVKAVYITCEDPAEELWRRQEAINKTLGITMDDIRDNLLLVSLKGHLNNELATFDSAARLSPTPRYHQIQQRVTEFGANLVFLDNAAHLFTGSENARHDVAAFLSLMERLSEDIDGAVVLLAHPNKQHAQGNKQGNEYSGSTGWSAHVRNRLFMDWPEVNDDGEPLDKDGRILRKSKANYGSQGDEISFRWHEWAFSTVDDLPSDRAEEMAANAEAAADNEVFLMCLDKAMQNRVATSASRAAANYAPRVFVKMPTAKKRSFAKLELAMQRLLHLGTIVGDRPLWPRANRGTATGLGRAE